MPPRSFFTTTANERGGQCCNFDLLKNEYKQNVIEQQTKPGLLNPTAACTPTTKITPTTTITRAARTRTEQKAGKQGKASQQALSLGGQFLRAAIGGYGVRRCDGNSDSVSVNANCFPHALGFGDW